MTTRMRVRVSSTVGGLILLAATVGLAGGAHGVVQNATSSQQASSIGYHLGSQAATGGRGNTTFSATGGRGSGIRATGGGGIAMTSTGGRR